MWNFPSGAKIEFGFLERDADVYRYQGQAYSWIGFDEITHLPTEFSWNYLASRLRTTDSEITPYMRCTANPGGVGAHWVKKRYIDPADPNLTFEGDDGLTRKFIPARLKDNPYLSRQGDYEAMLLSLPEQQRRQLLDGDWDIKEGAAFTEFDRNLHVIEPYRIPSNWVKFRACDYGYGSYSAVLWFAVAPSEQIIVYRELYVSKVLATDLADKVLELEAEDGNIKYGVLDSSLWHKRGDTGPSLAEQMIMRGCRWRPSDRSKGSRVAGKNEVHRRLQVDEFTEEPRMVFFNNCVNTVSQLPAIPLDKKNPEDVDTHSEDHLYDALRYGIMSRPRFSVFDYDPHGAPSMGMRVADNTFGY